MKMKRKLLSLLLALCLAIALVPMSAFAEESAADSWDGTADTSWYTDAPDASEYHISTAEQLAGLAQLVNADPGTTNFAGKTFYLENDLDLSGHEWISIGTGRGGTRQAYSFCGVFDGQGHVISNLYSRESHVEGADESHNLLRNALFGNVYNGEVKNLGVANAEIWMDPKDGSAAGKGILVDWMGKSKITNCWTSGSIYSGSSIEKNIGGIVGVTVQGCTISGCYSTATLTGNFTNSEGYYTEPDPADWPFDTIGGIVGARFDGNLTVTDCWFDGKIVVNSITAAVGGIVGYTDDQLGSGTVNNCMVTTTDMGVDKDGNTCWVAYAFDGTVENCYWPNDAKAYDPSPLAYVGGQSNEEQGTAISDFTSADVLDGLKTNASAGVEWVAGIGHPTFVWDDNNISADYTVVDATIASAVALDSSLYKNYSAVEDSINAVDRVKSKAQQIEVDAMAKAIEDAINALVYKDADYAKVDEAIAKVNALNKDNYKDFSGVEAAVNAVVRGKNITEQSEVDAMAKAIEDAIAALQYKGANYTKVDAAIAKAKALNKDNYKDFSGVEAAVKAVVRGKNITEQSEVDKMAKAIEKAIDALEYKGADYTKVDEAIAKAKALNKDNYKDFSGVEAAVKAVVRDKNITEQSEVDKMAKAIEKAIDALEYKGANYTKVDAAIAKAKALNKDNYKDFSGVEAAVKAVVRDKNITEQSEVDKMEKAIEDAIDALQYKGADYTKVDAAIAKAKALNKDNYKDFSGVDDAVKAVVQGKDITKQTEVDAMAKAIDDAISVLQYKDADYTKVDAVIAKAPEPSIASGNNNNTNTNGGRVIGTSDSNKNNDSRNNSDTEIKPYIKDDSGKKGWDVISSQLDEAKSGETVTVAMNGTTVVPKDIFDTIKGEDVTLVLDMGDGISWKINGKDITDAAGDIDFGVTVGADAGKSIPVDVINNVTGERYSMNLSLAYDGEFGFTAILTINMESKNTGLYANLFYYNEQAGKLEFVSAGLIDADGNVELEFTHASDYTVVIDAAVMDGGNKDSINTTKDNANAEDNTTIPASNADNAKSDAWNPAIIIIIGICILLIVFGAVIFVRKKSGSEEE